MKLAVRIFAILLLAAAVAMAFLYKGGKPEADNTPPPVRPVKSMLVGPPPRVPSIHFPGVVDARAGVDLSFEVGGRIVEFPATRGLDVKEGDVLARLDDRDYANSVKTAEAELAYAESNFKRMEAALAQNAVSQDEFSSARASRDKARAALDSAKKALDDTVLKARFSGVVSDTYADNFDTVAAGTPILKLQDLTAFDLAVSVPESYVLSTSADVRSRYTFTASFDSLPGRTFPGTDGRRRRQARRPLQRRRRRRRHHVLRLAPRRQRRRHLHRPPRHRDPRPAHRRKHLRPLRPLRRRAHRRRGRHRPHRRPHRPPHRRSRRQVTPHPATSRTCP